MALTSRQIQNFVRRGFVAVRGCFSPDIARVITDKAWERMGYDPRDRATWLQEKVFLPHTTGLVVKDFAPKAWEAICALAGGEERVAQADRLTFSDSLVVNLSLGREDGFRERDAWHVDGHHRHYLDSPEAGLLCYLLWSDLGKNAGGTRLLCDSIPRVARLLLSRPEGATQKEVAADPVRRGCRDVFELTGRAGDIFLVHPYMIHSESANPSQKPRFFSVTFAPLAEPMRFDRGAASESSPLERAVLHALRKKSVAFRRAAARAA